MWKNEQVLQEAEIGTQYKDLLREPSIGDDWHLLHQIQLFTTLRLTTYKIQGLSQKHLMTEIFRTG